VPQAAELTIQVLVMTTMLTILTVDLQPLLYPVPFFTKRWVVNELPQIVAFFSVRWSPVRFSGSGG
jgi:hypothetical protein